MLFFLWMVVWIGGTCGWGEHNGALAAIAYFILFPFGSLCINYAFRRWS
jgi:hypothetical protein